MKNTQFDFQISELLDKRANSDEPWLEFLNVPSLYCGVYVLMPGQADPQKPHAFDEVYHVLAGRARFEKGGEVVDVRAGSLLYVPAGVDHRFFEIEEELRSLVFFSRGPTSASDS